MREVGGGVDHREQDQANHCDVHPRTGHPRQSQAPGSENETEDGCPDHQRDRQRRWSANPVGNEGERRDHGERHRGDPTRPLHTCRHLAEPRRRDSVQPYDPPGNDPARHQAATPPMRTGEADPPAAVARRAASSTPMMPSAAVEERMAAVERGTALSRRSSREPRAAGDGGGKQDEEAQEVDDRLPRVRAGCQGANPDGGGRCRDGEGERQHQGEDPRQDGAGCSGRAIGRGRPDHCFSGRRHEATQADGRVAPRRSSRKRINPLRVRARIRGWNRP